MRNLINISLQSRHLKSSKNTRWT